MSMPLLPKAEPPDAPLVVAYLPELLIPTRIFSTLAAVNAVFFHALSNIPVTRIDGFQFAKTSAEKSVNDVQLRQP